MSIRINNAKNFKGKAYVAADELDSLIQSMQFATALLENTTTDNGWIVEFQYADQDGTTNKKTAVDLTAIKQYIDNKAINVAAGAGVTIDSITNPLNPKISADVDGTTIVLSGTGDTAKLATGLKLVKKTTANEGYAASYQLCNTNGVAITGSADIDLFKDQFLKTVDFGWATDGNGTGFVLPAYKTAQTTVPVIRFQVYVNNSVEGDDDSTDSDTVVQDLTFFVDCTTFYREYDAENGVAIVSGNVITAVKGTSEQVSIADGSTVDVLTIDSTGIGVTNIQKAINYAVDNEHAKASAAISAVDSNVVALATSVNAAVTSINTRVANVETNAATAVANASANLSTQIAGVATNASAAVSKIASAFDALNDAVASAVTNVNTNVETAIDSVVTNVGGALNTTVTNVNNAVSAAVDTVNTKVEEAVSSVNTQVGEFKNTVSATIVAEQAAVSSFMGSVNTVISAVEANRNAQLASAVQMIEDGNVALTSQAGDAGIYHATVTANNIVAVYDPDGIQIYPEISRTGNAKPYTYTLEAEYGSSVADGPWTVLYTIDLPAYNDGGNVTYVGGANTIAYTNADNGTNASYDTTTAAGAIAAVDATDVDYTGVADVAGTGVENGTAGTAGTGVATGSNADAPTVPDHVTKAAPNYTGYANA